MRGKEKILNDEEKESNSIHVKTEGKTACGDQETSKEGTGLGIAEEGNEYE